ncbi:hypothetical protein ACP70R_001497 [Stipagrostis hirtigluma subsp. patula]
MSAAALPSSWAELPEDILGQVLLRLPSLDDRVRLRAVCRPWRAGAAARRHPRLPPPLPWLALRDGSLVDLHGAPVRCAPIVREGVFSYLAFDNLAFLVHDDGACSLMNPLSGITLPLPKLAPVVRRALQESEFYNQSYLTKTHVKAILSSPLHSAVDPLVAVMNLEENNVAISACKQNDAICISMSPGRTRLSTRICATDIAFLHRKLYVLTDKLDAGRLSEPKQLSGFDQCINDDPEQKQIYYSDNPKQQQVYRIPGSDPGYLVLRYLAESNGRLLMVRRWMSFPANARLGDHDRTIRFEVFEADLTTVPGRWMKVESLAGQALFLGSECSKSVLASQFAGGIQEDCIYFVHRVFDNPSKEFFGPCVDPLADSGVYNMRDREFMPLMPEAVMTELRRKRLFLTWFFPADV